MLKCVDIQQTFFFLWSVKYSVTKDLFLQNIQAREFANELRASTKVSRNPTVWLEGSTGSSQNANTDTSAVSDAYAKMLTIFIPLLVDEVIVNPMIYCLAFRCN